MRILCLLLLFFNSLIAVAQEFEFDYQNDFKNILVESKQTNSALSYEKLISRFNMNDTSLSDYEVLCLLIGFTANENFKPYSYLSIERKIYALNDDGAYKKAIALCDSFLAKVPLSQQALIEKSYSFYKLKKQDSADFYSWRFYKIMDAMAQSGSGLSIDNAIFALGPSDGQNFIKKYLRSGIGSMGSSRDENGNFIDILEIIKRDKAGKEEFRTKLYFNIAHASKTMFSGQDIKKLMEKAKEK
jgi:hypothetical protein